MATKLFLTGVNSDVSGFLDMSTPAAGSGSYIVNAASSGTQIQWTASAGGSSIAWITGGAPAGGFTLTTTDISISALESAMTTNAGGRYRLFKLDVDGVTETELGGGPFDDGVEFGTGATTMTWVGNNTDMAFAENERLILRLYITNIGTMGTGTCQLDLGANTFLNLNETVAFKTQVPPTIVANNPADGSSDTDTTPTLEFTGSDDNLNDLRYRVQINSVNFTTSVVDSGGLSAINGGAWGATYGGSGSRSGQSFAGTSALLEAMEFRLAINGSPTGLMYARLYSHSGTFGTSSSPNALLATSEPIDVSTLSTTHATVRFYFPNGYTMSAGTNYVAILYFSGGDVSNYVKVMLTTTSLSGNAYYSNTSQSTDIAFAVYSIAAPTLNKVSGTDSGFVNTVNGGDSDPFTQGQKISFTVQAGDALADGTYYWRASASDPSPGSTFSSPWTTVRSFTIAQGTLANPSGSSATVSKTGVTVTIVQDATASPSGSAATTNKTGVTVTPTELISVSGSAATVSAGSVAVTQLITASPSGSAATADKSGVTVNYDFSASVSGSSATGGTGTVTVDVGSSATANVSGSSATVSAGSVTENFDLSFSVSGSSATISSDSVSATQVVSVSVSGSAATTANSGATVTQLITADVSGSSASVAAGSVSVATTIAVSVTGSSATISTGTATGELVTNADVNVVGSRLVVSHGKPIEGYSSTPNRGMIYTSQFSMCGVEVRGNNQYLTAARFSLAAYNYPVTGTLHAELLVLAEGSNAYLAGTVFPVSSYDIDASVLTEEYQDIEFQFAPGAAPFLESGQRYLVVVRYFGGDTDPMVMGTNQYADNGHLGFNVQSDNNGFTWSVSSSAPIIYTLYTDRTVDVPQEVSEVYVYGSRGYILGPYDVDPASHPFVDDSALGFYGVQLGDPFTLPNGERQGPGAVAGIGITGVTATPEELVAVTGASATANANSAAPEITLSQEVTPAGSSATASTGDALALGGFNDIVGSSVIVAVGSVTVEQGMGALPSGSQATVSITGCTVSAIDGFLTSSVATISTGTVSVTTVGADANPVGAIAIVSTGSPTFNLGAGVSVGSRQAVASVGTVAVDIGPYVSPAGVSALIAVGDVIVSLPVEVSVEGSALTITAGGEATRVLDDDVDFSFGTRSVRVPAETYSVLVPLEPHSVTVPTGLDAVTVPADDEEVTL